LNLLIKMIEKLFKEEKQLIFSGVLSIKNLFNQKRLIFFINKFVFQ